MCLTRIIHHDTEMPVSLNMNAWGFIQIVSVIQGTGCIECYAATSNDSAICKKRSKSISTRSTSQTQKKELWRACQSAFIQPQTRYSTTNLGLQFIISLIILHFITDIVKVWAKGWNARPHAFFTGSTDIFQSQRPLQNGDIHGIPVVYIGNFTLTHANIETPISSVITRELTLKQRLNHYHLSSGMEEHT